MAPSAEDKKTRAPRPCPLCNKMSVERYFPFCSDRCANIDLHRWLGEGYRLPTSEPAGFGDGEPRGDDVTEE